MAAAAVTTSIAIAVKRSWADVAKGGEGQKVSESNAPAALKPARQGSLLCHCRGEVLMMLSHYGWLMVYGKVDHPAAEKHEGHVYISKSDIVDGKPLKKGDVVSFYLYTDEKGLGAEMVEVEESAAITLHPKPAAFRPPLKTDTTTPVPCMNPNAADFVPMAKQSDAPSVAFDSSSVVLSLRADAQEFIPSVCSTALTSESMAVVDKSIADLNMRLFSVFNSACLSDDEDDDDAWMDSECNDGGGSSHDGDAESSGDESDGSSTDGKVINRPHALSQLPPSCAPSIVRRAVSPDASTCSGLSSDSEVESAGEWLSLDNMMPRGFRPPPGLSLPAGLRAPSDLKAMFSQCVASRQVGRFTVRDLGLTWELEARKLVA